MISANSPFQLPGWKWVRLGLFVACDIFVVSLSYLLAFVLRLDDWSLGSYHQFALKSLPLVVAIHLFFSLPSACTVRSGGMQIYTPPSWSQRVCCYLPRFTS